MEKYYLLLLKKMYSVAPVSSSLTIAGNFIIALIPALITAVIADITESVSFYTVGQNTKIHIITMGIVLVTCYIIQQAVEFILSITVNAGVYEKCNSQLKIDIAEKASRLSLIQYEDAGILDMHYRANDCINKEIPSRIFISILTASMNFFSIFLVITVLAGYNFLFVPISIISVIPFYIAKKIRGDEFYKINIKRTKDNREVNYLWGLFTQKEAIKEMRIMSFGNYIMDKWLLKKNQLLKEIWLHNLKEIKSMFFCDIIKVTGYFCCILFSVYFVLNGFITIGSFAACLTAFSIVQDKTKEFLVKLSDIRNNGIFIKDYFNFINLSEKKRLKENEIHKIDGIKLEHINFSYPGTEKLTLHDINIFIKSGERIAIVGENGSGKSTLCKLILNIYQPDSGNIYFDDNCSSFSIVSQNFVKYKLSLRENIAISDTKRIDNTEDIIRLIKLLNYNDLIKENGNIDYQLGTEFDGDDLSGGQWQTIAIARSMFKHAGVFILDEPTSALDPIVEEDILNKFLELSFGKTSIMVLHRMGLCKSVDRILVMKYGTVIETGSHEQLMAKKEEYYRLYREQSKWYQ